MERPRHLDGVRGAGRGWRRLEATATAAMLSLVMGSGGCAQSIEPIGRWPTPASASGGDPTGSWRTTPAGGHLGLAFAGNDASVAGATRGTALPRPATDILTPADAEQTPAFRIGNLGRAACEEELTRKGIPFSRVEEARGVLAPVRLTGPVAGVSYHASIPAKDRATSSIEVFDCRLVLALEAFGAILRAHDVVEVVHMSAWRPPSRRWPAGKIGGQHEGALALDAAVFVRANGPPLIVEKDFHGRIGARTCGPGTGPSPAVPEAKELRAIACETADAHLFQVELTPDFNAPHRNHFHLEVRPSTSWFLVH